MTGRPTALSVPAWACAALGLGLGGCIALQPREGGRCDLAAGLGCADGWQCVAGECRPSAPATPDPGTAYDGFEQYPAGELPAQSRFGRWQLLEGSAAIEEQPDFSNKRLLLRGRPGAAGWVTLSGSFQLGGKVALEAADAARISVGPFTLALTQERWEVSPQSGALPDVSALRTVQLRVETGELVVALDGTDVGRWPWSGGAAPVTFAGVGEARFDDVYGVTP